MPSGHLVGRFSLFAPSPWRRILATVSLTAVLVTALPAAPGTFASDPTKDPLFGRAKNDPIRLAKKQRNALQDRIQNGHQKLTDLTTTSSKLSTDLKATTTALDTLTANLDDVQAQVNQATADLLRAETQQAALQQQVETLDWSLQILSDQADALASDLDNRRRQLGARLADAYRATQPALWEQVIGSGSFVSGIVQQQGSLALGQHDKELAESIVRDQAVLDEQRRQLRQLRYQTGSLHEQVAAHAVTIAVQRDTLQKQQEKLGRLQAAKQKLQAEQQARLSRILKNKAQTAALLKQQAKQAKDLVSKIKHLLDKERHSGRLPSKYNRTFRWPLIARISQEYGCTHFALEPPRGNCDHFHGGIDIVAPYGAPIRAAGDGIIMWVGWDDNVPKKDAAYYVLIGHDRHLTTVYGHLQPRSPKWMRVGAKVKEGQVIGWEGNTGNSTGPHLHWSVYKDGEPENPRFFL
jgi:murein DD-endopeptidase MepM/ murein hydrolase activator NlpD